MLVGTNGRVTIPKHLREALGIDAGSQVTFDLTGDQLTVRKTADTPSRGTQLVARLHGRGEIAMSTDEILALVRGATSS